MYCNQSESDQVGDVCCVNCDIAVTVCNIVFCDRSECDRIGHVYCVNCNNVSKMLVLYVTLCIVTVV